METAIIAHNKLTIQRILGAIFVFFSTFPWVSFGTNSMDTQPWFIILGLLFVVSVAKFPVRRSVYFIFFILGALVLTLMFSEIHVDFILARAIVSYTAFVFVFFGFYVYVMRYGFPWKIFIFSNITWLVVAILQVLYGKTIFEFLVLVRTTETRGVTSLAVEPAYFGMFLFFVSWMYLIAGNYKLPFKIWLLVFLNIVFIVFFSQSFMIVLFLVVAVCFLLVGSFSLRYFTGIFLTFVIFFSLAYYLINLMPGTRLFTLCNKAFSVGVLELMYSDASINQRLADVVFPIQGFFENYGLPGGFHSYSLMHSHLVDVYNGFFWFGGKSDKIMSFLGAFIYELGFFAVLFFVGLFSMLWDGTRKRFAELGLFIVLLNSAIPVAFPLVAMIFSLLLFFKSRSVRSLNQPAFLKNDETCKDRI
jgi:hypothetical protein